MVKPMKRFFCLELSVLLLTSLLMGRHDVKAWPAAAEDGVNRNRPVIEAGDDEAHIEQLYYLCKVWGFLKYYHIGVAQGDMDWDQVLLSTLESIGTVCRQEDFLALLDQMIEDAGIQPVPDSDPPVLPEENLRNFDLSWLEDEFFTEDISGKLRTIYERFRPMDSRFVEEVGTFSGGNPKFNDSKYHFDEVSSLTRNIRLLGLFRYWNIIEYFHPSKYRMDQSWNETLLEFVPLFEAASGGEGLEYVQCVYRMTARLNDGHGFVSSPFTGLIEGLYYIPALLVYLEDDLIIKKTYGEDSELKPGDIVEAIDGIPVDSLEKQFNPFLRVSNESARARAMCSRLSRGPRGEVILTLNRQGSRLTVTVDRRYDISHISGLINRKGPHWRNISFGGKKIGYVDIDRLERDNLEAAMDAIWDSDALIMDLRGYPRFFISHYVRYLFDSPIEIANSTVPDVRSPGTIYWMARILGTGDFSKTYSKPLYILMNERTKSQAEYTVMGLEQHPRAVKVGRQTAGADGNISLIHLPGRTRLNFSGLGIYYPDGRPTQRIGILPDIEVQPTLEGIMNDRDEVLEAALNHLNQTAVHEEQTAAPSNGRVAVYPNPFTERTCVTFTLLAPVRVGLTVHSSLGRLMATPLSGHGVLPMGRHDIDIDTQGWPAGMYVVQLRVGGKRYNTKIIKVK